MKRSGTWRKTNGYEVFNHAMCLHCAFFKMDTDLPIHGECSLMNREGAYEGVMADAVCNRFISRQGTDISGMRPDPGLPAAFFEIEKLNGGEIRIPRSSVA